MTESTATAGVSQFADKSKNLLMNWGVPLLGGVAGFFLAPLLFKGAMGWVADYIWGMGKGADWTMWSGEISFLIFFMIFLAVTATLWKMSAGNWLLRGLAGMFAGITIRIGLGAAQSMMYPGPGPAPHQFEQLGRGW